MWCGAYIGVIMPVCLDLGIKDLLCQSVPFVCFVNISQTGIYINLNFNLYMKDQSATPCNSDLYFGIIMLFST